MTTFYFSTPHFTFLAEVNEKGIVVETAPIAHKFIGQPVKNLYAWVKKFPEAYIEELPPNFTRDISPISEEQINRAKELTKDVTYTDEDFN